MRADIAQTLSRIDDDHAQLHVAATRFREVGYEGGHSPEHTRTLLNFLTKYVVEHFRREEELMHLVHYRDTQVHKVEHYRLWRAVLDLQTTCEADGYDHICTNRVAQLLITWLADHMRYHDAPMITWVRSHAPDEWKEPEDYHGPGHA